MRKFISSLLFFGSFGVTFAQMGVGSGPNPYWWINGGAAQLHAYSMPEIVTSFIPAPINEAMGVFGAVRQNSFTSSDIERIDKCYHSDTEINHCKSLQPNCYIGWEQENHRCMGGPTTCRPATCETRPPFSVKITNNDLIPVCKNLPPVTYFRESPSGSMGVHFEISGGTKPYYVNGSKIGDMIGIYSIFYDVIGASQSKKVTIRDSSSPKQVKTFTIQVPACRKRSFSCKDIKNQGACDDSPACQWKSGQLGGPMGPVMLYCTDKDPSPSPSDYLCVRGGNCNSDSDCFNPSPVCGTDTGPLGGQSSKQCMSSLKCERHTKCLAESTKIATPIGDIAVTSLKVGDIVWTVDAAGKRIVRSLIKVSRVSAPNHRVVHLVLADGRTLDVSALHPAVGGMTVGDLQVGDAYDGSVVKGAVVKPYEGTATHDILPAGDTGYYWANGILMGSTLK